MKAQSYIPKPIIASDFSYVEYFHFYPITNTIDFTRQCFKTEIGQHKLDF